MDADYAFLYRGAIALNNIGVALMQQHRFRDAMDTITDSVAAIQACLPGSPQLNRETLVKRLHDASKRNFASSCVNVPDDGVLVVSVEDSDIFSTLHHNEGLYTDKDTFCPIRIRHAAESEDGSAAVDFQTAVVLFNMGLTHLALARQQRQESDAAACRTAGLHVLRLGYSIVYNRFLNSSEDSDSNDEDRVLLMAMILKKVILALKELRMFSQAEEAYDALLVLDKAMKQMDCFEVFEEQYIPCPASAA